MDTVPPRTYNNSNFPEGLPAVSLSDEERARQQRWTPLRVTIWILISAIAGLGWWMLAVRRGETVNGIWFVFAAIGSYFNRASSIQWISCDSSGKGSSAVPWVKKLRSAGAT